MKEQTSEKADPITRTTRCVNEDELAEAAAQARRLDKVQVPARKGWATRKVLDVTVDTENLEVRISVSGGRRVTATAFSEASELTTDKSDQVTLHELGHRMEHTNPRVLWMQEVFYRRRTTDHEHGGLTETVSYRGSAEEWVRPDGFVDDYIGKDYQGRAYEVLSVGMESIFGGSRGALVGADHERVDHDHRAFVLGLLATT
jgi:hypothetical protein